MTRKIKIALGPLAASISEQIKTLTLASAEKQQVREFEKDQSAIDRLYLRGYLSEEIRALAYYRLVEKVTNLVNNNINRNNQPTTVS